MSLTPQTEAQGLISPRQRVLTALGHKEPDRVPTDFLATPEIWRGLVDEIRPDIGALPESDYFSAEREAVLRHFQIDCRVVSYDMFCHPPDTVLHPGAVVDWWQSLARSTPCRMWRQHNADGTWHDIWGIHTRRVENASGAYEELASHPLAGVASVDELRTFRWPEPDWWDFRPLGEALRAVDPHHSYAWRYRIGSVFELAWQLRGIENFLTDLATDPAIPLYIMERLADVHAENTRRVLDQAGDWLDMVYFYDDVATQNSLMISKPMWRRNIRPLHERIVAPAKSKGKLVMYHCDGAIYPLIPELLDLGVDILNPVQPDAQGMALGPLKEQFGARLSFHGGIDIIKTLPSGTPEEVAAEVRDRISILGQDGGYILASSHHIQADTPLRNVAGMYDLSLRTR